MTTYSRLACAVLCLLSILSFGGSVAGQGGTTRTTATFDGPVQLPGVELPSGRYQFALAADRRSVVVSDAANRVLARLAVAPISRAERGDIITMRPSAGGTAPEVAALFSNGGTAGVEFIWRRTAAAPPPGDAVADSQR